MRSAGVAVLLVAMVGQPGETEKKTGQVEQGSAHWQRSQSVATTARAESDVGTRWLQDVVFFLSHLLLELGKVTRHSCRWFAAHCADLRSREDL